jgi:uncharacterized protein YjbI with pentapeptide repeats
MRMIAKDPDDRYQSIEEVLADLKIVKQGGTPKPPPARPVSPESDKQGNQSPSKVEETPVTRALRYSGVLAGDALAKSDGGETDRRPPVRATQAAKSGPGKIHRPGPGVFKECRNFLIRRQPPSLNTVVVVASFFGVIFGVFTAAIAIQILAGGYSIFNNAAAFSPSRLVRQYSTRFLEEEPRYYSVTKQDSFNFFGEQAPELDIPLRDGHNRVIFYYNRSHLRDAVRQAVAANESLRGACLQGANLSGLYLPRAHLAEADLSDCQLSSATLWSVDLSGANLTNATLFNCRIRDSDLTGANLTNARLQGAQLRRCNLSGVTLTGTEITPEMIDGTERFYEDRLQPSRRPIPEFQVDTRG